MLVKTLANVGWVEVRNPTFSRLDLRTDTRSSVCQINEIHWTLSEGERNSIIK